jgi:chromosome partitioning protein
MATPVAGNADNLSLRYGDEWRACRIQSGASARQPGCVSKDDRRFSVTGQLPPGDGVRIGGSNDSMDRARRPGADRSESSLWHVSGGIAVPARMCAGMLQESVADTFGSPLHRAAIYDYADMASLLIEKGADFNAIDKISRTAVSGPARLCVNIARTHEDRRGHQHQGRSRQDNDCRELAFLCAAGGRTRTLLWDLDPQGAATYVLRCEPQENASAKKLVSGKRELNELVVASGHDRLDVLPADFSYRHFDVHLSSRKNPTERLLRMSRSLREVYDVLFLDCPSGISLLSENVLRAADAVVVPLLPSPLSVRMLIQLRDFLVANAWVDMTLLPFFSMVDRRKALHHEVIASTRLQFPGMLKTEVPYWSEIERMTAAARSAPGVCAAQRRGKRVHGVVVRGRGQTETGRFHARSANIVHATRTRATAPSTPAPPPVHEPGVESASDPPL